MIAEFIRSRNMRRTRIRSNQYQLTRLLQRERSVHVLQQDDTGRVDLPHKFSVITLHVYVFVRGLIEGMERVEVGLWVVWRILSEKVPGSQDARRHIIHARLGDYALLYVRREICAKVRRAGIKGDVTGHGHVEPGYRADR